MLFLAPPEIQEHCERDSIYTTSATPKTKRSHIAAIPTEILRKIIKYVEDPCYPVKSLFMVVDWLNHEYEPELALYSSQSATQLRLYAKLSRNLGKYDLSILDAMQVCRVWRDVVLEVIFGGDTRKWSNREWNQKLARLQEAREWNEKFLDTSKTTNREVRHREQPSKRRKAQPGFDTAVARKNCFTDYCQIWEPGYESKSGMPQDGCHVDKFCGLPGTKVCVNSGGQVSSQMRKQNGLHRYRIFPSLRNSTIIHLTPPPTMATINDLPSEVLFMIMTYIRPLEPAPCPPPTTPRLWQQPPRPTIDLLPTSQHLGDFLCIYDAMRVCRRWRDIALETILYSTSPTIGDNWSLKEMIEVVKAIELDTAQNLCWWTREADVVKLPPNLLWRIVRSRLCVAKEG